MRKILSIIVMVAFLLTGCGAGNSQTSGEVKVIDITEKSITVQDTSGEQITVKIPQGISKLIEANKYYYLVYKSSSQGKNSELISIEPSVEPGK